MVRSHQPKRSDKRSIEMDEALAMLLLSEWNN
jgi:hypothetical protein